MTGCPSTQPFERILRPHTHQLTDLDRRAELAELTGLVELIASERAAERHALSARNKDSGFCHAYRAGVLRRSRQGRRYLPSSGAVLRTRRATTEISVPMLR